VGRFVGRFVGRLWVVCGSVFDDVQRNKTRYSLGPFPSV
jgi:hypothetical protein